MKKEEEINYNYLNLYLEGGESIMVKYPNDAFDDIYSEIHQAMRTGSILNVQNCDVQMWYDDEDSGIYLDAINGRKIIGYSY